MTIKDTFSLALSKLKRRKFRTAATILSISILFGVISAVFLAEIGLMDTLKNAAQTKNSGKVYLKVSLSSLTSGTQINAQQNLKTRLQNYNATILASQEYYIDSDDYTDEKAEHDIILLDQQFSANFKTLQNTDQDAIPIILPTNIAGQILNIPRPQNTNNNLSETESYLSKIEQNAIGHIYTAEGIKYQITGLTPSFGNLRLAKKPGEFQLFDIVLPGLSTPSTMSIVIGDPPPTLIESYTISPVKNSIIEFNDAEEAWSFWKNNSCNIPENHCSDFYIEEFANNHMLIRSTFSSVDSAITFIAPFFVGIAAIIMLSMLARIIDDERQSLALYRSQGASTKNLIQIYGTYIFVICIMTCVSSLVISALLVGLLSLSSSTDLAANISLFYSISDYHAAPIIGFDSKIILIWLTIFLVGAIGMLFTTNKILSKNLIQSLKS